MLFRRPTPPENDFFTLFKEHASFVAEAAEAFLAMVDQYDDTAARETLAQAVCKAENRADRVTAEVHRLLHKSKSPTVNRDQIHGLINALDDIADLLQDATETMTLYDIQTVTREVRQLAELGVRCCSRVVDAVELLAKIDTEDVAEAVFKTCEEIDRLESDADRVMREAMSRLFREEPDVRELIKLKAIYEQLEEITDRCEDVANMIEGVVLERS
jgi:uncharacterized protein